MTATTSRVRDSRRGAHADDELVQRIVGGDQAAVGELYDRHCRIVYGLVLRILNDRVAAEDVLQEVFLRVWMKTETYDGARGPAATWLIGIARNQAIDRLRRDRLRSSAKEAAPRTAASAGAATCAAADEPHSVVARALYSLPRDQRELIEQAFFQGWTTSELAERFGLSIGTVRIQIRTGLLKLSEQLTALADRGRVLERDDLGHVGHEM